LGVEAPPGGGTVSSTLIVALAVWAYHALVLREDMRLMPVAREQAGVRRLYRYLVAGVGLLALLIGLGGVLGVLFDTTGSIVSQQKVDLAWFAAAMLAGVAVWIVPWRLIQQETAELPPAGISARASVVRRFYLFFFLLLATLTFLIAAVFILSRVLTVLLGEALAPGEISNIALAAAFLLMAAAVWLYHGWLLREDNEALEAYQKERAADLHVIVVDDGNGRLGRRLVDALASASTGMQVTAIGLTAEAADAMGQEAELDARSAVTKADIIIGPWSISTSITGDSIVEAIAASPAKKLLLPRPARDWQLVGQKAWEPESAVRETVQLVEEIAAGDLPLAQRPVTPGMIALLIASTILILILIMSLMDEVLPLF
jgi:hypothetical protein